MQGMLLNPRAPALPLLTRLLGWLAAAWSGGRYTLRLYKTGQMMHVSILPDSKLDQSWSVSPAHLILASNFVTLNFKPKLLAACQLAFCHKPTNPVYN